MVGAVAGCVPGRGPVHPHCSAPRERNSVAPAIAQGVMEEVRESHSRDKTIAFRPSGHRIGSIQELGHRTDISNSSRQELDAHLEM